MIYIALTVGKCWENTHNSHPILIYDPYRIRWGLQFFFFLTYDKTPLSKVICHIYHKFRGYFFSHFSVRQLNASLNGGPILYLYCRNHTPWISFVPREVHAILASLRKGGGNAPVGAKASVPNTSGRGEARVASLAMCLNLHTYIHTYIHTYTHTHIDIYNHIYIYIYGSDGANMQDVDLTNNNTDYINIILKIGMYQILRPTLGIQL